MGLEENACITISLSHNTDYLFITIADNGRGMDEHIRKNAFKPFFTTHKGTQAKGLGLTVAHNIIVENHQGAIMLESMPLRGTTLTITLPY